MENKKKTVIKIGFMLGNLINSDYTIGVIFNDKDSNHQEFYLQSNNKYCSIKCFLLVYIAHDHCIFFGIRVIVSIE